jgi:hypothetical protein
MCSEKRSTAYEIIAINSFGLVGGVSLLLARDFLFLDPQHSS